MRLNEMLLLALMVLVCSGCARTVVSAAPSSGGGGSSSSEKEIEECAEQLAGLATCLPYVGGTAKSPTPDCCGGLKQLLNTNKKCLCVIIKDRDDPQLGLHINLTLAMSLPAVCNSASAANISKCPGSCCICLQTRRMPKCSINLGTRAPKG
ncbi:unnamed protein product [Linum tenue]|uniref:Bifunctional inhibitor/plant lipid transfer protein/seed storage helical domain-containing protein n=1 Tax=Linum tenue TaxID=586396 RepID=A0AAV0KIL0_9ROSI|nr:unnamed protein product [Linum tenue]